MTTPKALPADIEDALRGLMMSEADWGRLAEKRHHDEEKARLQANNAYAKLTALLSGYVAQLREAEKDGERLDYAAKHYIGADFEYRSGGAEPVSALIIEIPKSARITSDFREAIDAARRADTPTTEEGP